ncbi:MAG: CoA transferase [Betaproteobacteria bacterium]|nr:CoA transferase [Betaproteobacteria bacterium]
MPQAALRELLGIAGIEGEAQIAGADPVLKTPYRVGTAGAAALAATGIAAAVLWQLRTGRSQCVAVDLRAAAVSLKSSSYLRIDGKPPAAMWDPFSLFYPVKDGRWVRFHCNYPRHRAAALGVLGVGEDLEAAKRAAASWDGLALEDAIHAAGGCAALVRSAKEWASHLHAAAVEGQSLLEIERIGDAPPMPLPKAERPLSGVRALDLTHVFAGPTAAKTLAEHGADVLKITAAQLPDSGDIDLDTGIGKLSAQLDLREAADVETLMKLVCETDVFSQSYRPGALASRGFSPEALAKLRPGIVYVSLSAWGTTGPWKDRRGFDSMVQCVSGMAAAQGGADSPKLLPCSAIDYVSGYLMAFGTMVALARRAREGGSWLVRVALARTGKWIVDRGTVDAAGAVEPDASTMETPSPAGRITHLKPVVQLSETPPFWARPPVPLGHHRPVWP